MKNYLGFYMETMKKATLINFTMLPIIDKILSNLIVFKYAPFIL